MKTQTFARSDQATAPSDLRTALRVELARRCARNPRYTLRTFAHFLGIDHSTLSQVLRGKRRVTAATVRKLGPKVGLTRESLERLVATAEATPIPASAKEARQLARDTAQAIADWRPLAILELTRLAEFVPKSGWIARVLGLTVDEVNVTLQLLLRLGFLEFVDRTTWIDRLGDAAATEASFATAALERLARQLADQPAGDDRPRLHQTVTFAVKNADLPGLLARLEAVERAIDRAAATEAGDQVYRLDLHLFPLTDSTRG